MKKKITVFTPTYNRAYCLGQCYDSLLKQTDKNFIWLIIDDGSFDDTKKLVEGWIALNLIEIKYFFQENQGMHGAHNAAYKLITTELSVCIDSDDFMPKDAIEIILKFWEKNGNEKYAGIIGLDADKQNKIIGTKIPEHIKETTVTDLYQKHKIKGDKKLVYRTDIIRKYPPYPIFKGERFVPLGYIYQIIDQDYKVLPLNKVLCIVEYLPDGSSLNMLKQYRNNPKGFSFSRITEIKYAKSLKERLKKTIHYVATSLLSKNKNFIKESPKKTLTIFVIPLGIILCTYILLKTKKR